MPELETGFGDPKLVGVCRNEQRKVKHKNSSSFSSPEVSAQMSQPKTRENWDKTKRSGQCVIDILEVKKGTRLSNDDILSDRFVGPYPSSNSTRNRGLAAGELFSGDGIKSPIEKFPESRGNVLLENDLVNHENEIVRLAEQMAAKNKNPRRKVLSRGKKVKSAGLRR